MVSAHPLLSATVSITWYMPGGIKRKGRGSSLHAANHAQAVAHPPSPGAEWRYVGLRCIEEIRLLPRAGQAVGIRCIGQAVHHHVRSGRIGTAILVFYHLLRSVGSRQPHTGIPDFFRLEVSAVPASPNSQRKYSAVAPLACVVSLNSAFTPRQTGFNRKSCQRRWVYQDIHRGAVADGGCPYQCAYFQADGVHSRVGIGMGYRGLIRAVSSRRRAVAKVPVPLGDGAVAGAHIGKGKLLVLAQQTVGCSWYAATRQAERVTVSV